MTGTSSPARNVNRDYWITAVALPLGILCAGVAIALLVKDQIVAEVPLHWGTNGPDRYGSISELIFTVGGIGFATIGIFGVLGARIGKEVMTQRIIVVTNMLLAGLMGTIVAATALLARGITDTSTVELSTSWIAGAIIGSLTLGTALSLLIKGKDHGIAVGTPSSAAPRTQLSESEFGVWVRREISIPSLAVGAFAVLLTAGSAVITGAWGLLAVPGILGLLLATMFVWDLQVDVSGFRAASGLGIFKRRIPLAEIQEAAVVETKALRDFGGWGWRTALDGATGIILRSGESLELKLSNDRVFVVTTKDATTAAGLLNTMIERVRQNQSEL